MPNHCHNRVTFYSEDTTVIQRLYNIFKSDNIFTQFIPEPDWKTTPNDKGELPIQPEKDSMMPPQFPDGTTDDRWYSWRLANWGTKWDAYEVEIDDSELHYGFEVSFDTAWSPPEEICYAIKDQFDDLCVSWFFDEPGMEVAGYL
tara:strand:+ start:352 stop:786 length:435 start_codon:yes stop_codon:yes gene_type:complete